VAIVQGALYMILFVGTRFLCSVLVAPVRNESSEIILFIVNLEDITDAPLKYDSYRGSLRHSLYTSHVVSALLLVYYRFIVVSLISVKITFIDFLHCIRKQNYVRLKIVTENTVYVLLRIHPLTKIR